MAVFQPPPTYADPIIVDDRTGRFKFNPIWLKWFLDLVQIVNASGGGTGGVVHNDTTGKQGGGGTEFYHLTAAQNTLVAAISASAVQINQLASGLSVTITTAKLTAIGANGSMTFTNGVLTAQVAAT